MNEQIEKLIDDHLVGVYIGETSSMKAHYKVTVINLVDFINTYFTPKKSK